MENLDWLPTSPFPRDPLYASGIYAGGAGPQTNNLDLENNYHAFKVYVMELKQPNAKAGVEYESTLFKAANSFEKQTITGLLTERLNFEDSGWTPFPTEEKIVYLKGTISNGLVTAVNVGWDWSAESLAAEKRVDISNGRQTAFYLPIARLFRYGQNPVRFGVEQYVTTNLVLADVVIDGVICKYPTVDPLSVQFTQYAFQLIPSEQDGVAALRVSYGEINGEAPDEMVKPSNGNPQGGYVMETPPSGWIYAIITFDRITREITSRTIGYGQTIPDDRPELVHFPIGEIEKIPGPNPEGPDTYRILHQAQCGHINFREYIIVKDGRYARDYIHAYSRSPVPFGPQI
jgi:hypothetical protein